jgi:hypothetical protein
MADSLLRITHRLLAFATLTGFVILYTAIGFAAGWMLRWSQDRYEVDHEARVADRAAQRVVDLSHELLLRDLKDAAGVCSQ